MTFPSVARWRAGNNRRLMGLLSKTLFVMNIAVIIVLSACLTATAAGYSQVTLKEKDAPLTKVFKELKKQSGYDFLFNAKLVDRAGAVSVQISNESLDDALKVILKDKNLAFEIVEKTVIIKEKSVAPITSNEAAETPPIDIHGRVTDSLGNPLAGASITMKGSRNGTVTDANGNFSLSRVNDNAILMISYTGYVSRQYRVSDNHQITVILEKSNSPLDEVQVIAYGTQTTRFSVGDVSTVNADDIAKQPVTNPLLALEGRVPGLFISQSTGMPGSGVTVQIQGQNSIANGNDPFYVIDGVPYTSQLLPNFGTMLGSSNSGGLTNSQAGNPLSYLNPSDIESISVLKDAAATAIYGSRAANGAILITTKKGKAGQTAVNINLQDGWGQVTRKLDLTNLNQYLQMRHEAINNDGSTTGPGDYDINGTWDSTRNTDWQKKLIGKTVQYVNLNSTLSGGTVNVQYLVGATFHRETSVFPDNFSDQKGALHFNINSVSVNQKFKFQFSGNYLIDDNRLPNSDLTGAAITLAPDAPPLYNSDGSLNWAPTSAGSSTWYNPLAFTYNTYSNKANNLISNAVISYSILPGLDIRSSFGYTNLQTTEVVKIPLLSTYPEFRPQTPRAAEYGNNNINSWIIEPQISYERNIGKGGLDLLLGSTIDQSNSNGTQLLGIGYNSDQVLDDIRSAGIVQVISTVAAVYKYTAAFARLDYNWKEKYIIDLTERRDGSSRFGPANQFHDFGAAGIAWIFSKETFIQNTLPFLSFGKLRASYGTTGSDQIGNYQYLNLYSPTSASVAYQGAGGLQPNGLSNPYLQWEETTKMEVGLDLGALKDRILFNVIYYHNRSSNQLLGYALPIITGFEGITRNFPATVQNTGWEFTLTTTNFRSKDFSWSTHINLTIPQNKLVAFPNLSTSSYSYFLVIGKPITLFKAYHFLGVNPSTGEYQFSDGKEGITSAPDSNTQATQTDIINTSPTVYGGFQNNFRYKGFELDLLFQFVKQKASNYYFGAYVPGAFNGGQGNQPASVLSRWQKAGDVTSIQRYNADYSLGQSYIDAGGSDAGFSDASYIRLKNLSLSWQLPDSWKGKSGLQSCRFFVQGQNLLTITKYKGLDPETKSSTSLPPLRVFTFGLKVGL